MRKGVRGRAPWAAIAGIGQVHWFFGNLYEAAVDMPRLLADARPNREPRLLGAGSPLRYYLPAPVTLASTAAALSGLWRSGADRRVVLTAAAGTASATALTAYLVKTVNLPLLHDGEPLSPEERDKLVTTWHRGNLARLACLVVAGAALHRAEHDSTGR
jgi:hypothetical protein